MSIKKLRIIGILVTVLFTASAMASSGRKIDEEANCALDTFKEEISGSEVFMNQAAG